MITIKLGIDTCQTVGLGYSGENLAREYGFDFTAWAVRYGEGALQMLVQRLGDSDPYPVVLTAVNHVAVWSPSSTDTAVPGVVRLQLTYTVDNVMVESAIFTGTVHDALTVSSDPPDPYETWLDTLTELAATTIENAQAAANSAQNAASAKRAAEDAQTAAESAEASAISAAGAASSAADDAEDYATLSKSYAVDNTGVRQGEDTDNAKYYSEQAAASSTAASNSAASAYDSAAVATQIAGTIDGKVAIATNAANAAAGSASSAQGYANAAQGHANDAYTYAGAASQSASEAYQSEQDAADHERNAGYYAGIADDAADRAETAANAADGYATTASNKADAAALSATNASNSATAANNAKIAAQTAQGLAEAAQTAAEAAAASVQGALNTKAPVIVDSASGSIASFPDGSDMPMVEIDGAIVPQQDLHGYANPWPAGGGKNILKPTATTTTDNDVEFTVNSDGTVVANGTASANALLVIGEFNVVSGETYTYSGLPSAGSNTTYSIQIMRGSTAIDTNNATAKTYTATATETLEIRLVVRSGYTANNLLFSPMVRVSGDNTFAPYSNICPITGWTGANVYDTGKNMYGGSLVDGFAPINSYIKDGVNCWVLGDIIEQTNCYLQIRRCAKGVTPTTSNTTNLGSVISGTTVSSKQFIPDLTAYDYYFYSTSAYTNIKNVQITRAQPTLASYEPYSGTTLPITWQSSAGTVYGGNFVISEDGSVKLRATAIRRNLGSDSWEYNSTYNVFVDISGRMANEGVWICEAYPYKGIYSSMTDVSCGFIFTDRLAVRDSSYNGDAAAFKSAMDGVYAVTPLKPSQYVEYDLSDVTILSTLKGENNVWCDTGSISVDYRADTKLFIEKLTMPTEDDMVANQAITSGKYFMIGNSLYLALANIASGAQITIGTNAQRVSLAEALNTINS